MTTYKELFGKAVKFLSSDPANDAEGQVWYNSTSGTFKSLLATGAWSSGAPMITATGALDPGNIGSQSDTLAAGGYTTTTVNKTNQKIPNSNITATLCLIFFGFR